VVLALVVVAVLVLFLLRKIGDVVPGLLFLGLGVAVMLVVPPTWPVGWQMGLIFVAPLFAAACYKKIRGDKRGIKGSHLP
jgi:hypothetical protein